MICYNPGDRIVCLTTLGNGIKKDRRGWVLQHGDPNKYVIVLLDGGQTPKVKIHALDIDIIQEEENITLPPAVRDYIQVAEAKKLVPKLRGSNAGNDMRIDNLRDVLEEFAYDAADDDHIIEEDVDEDENDGDLEP